MSHELGDMDNPYGDDGLGAVPKKKKVVTPKKTSPRTVKSSGVRVSAPKKPTPKVGQVVMATHPVTKKKVAVKVVSAIPGKPVKVKPVAAKKKTSPLKKVGKVAKKVPLKKIGKVGGKVLKVVGGGAIASIPIVGQVSNIKTQAAAAGIKLRRKKKAGGGEEVVGVNADDAVVTAPLPIAPTDPDVERGDPLPVVSVQAPPPPVPTVEAVQRATATGTAIDMATVQTVPVAGTTGPRIDVLPDDATMVPAANMPTAEETDRRLKIAGRITGGASHIRDEIAKLTGKARGITSAVDNVLDTADAGGEAIVGGSRAAVDSFATGSADAGNIMAALTSKPVLIIGGGLAAMYLLSGSGGGGGRRRRRA